MEQEIDVGLVAEILVKEHHVERKSALNYPACRRLSSRCESVTGGGGQRRGSE